MYIFYVTQGNSEDVHYVHLFLTHPTTLRFLIKNLWRDFQFRQTLLTLRQLKMNGRLHHISWTWDFVRNTFVLTCPIIDILTAELIMKK